MKIKINILALVVLGGAMLFLSTCKQPDTNPCAGAKEPTADFRMMESDYYSPDIFETYDTDTALSTLIMFTATEPNAVYEWKTGSDTVVRRQQKFTLDFTDYYNKNYPNVPPVSITLKVTKFPGTCFPVADSVHYQTRFIYFTSKTLIRGSFRGHFNNDTALKTITIYPDTLWPHQFDVSPVFIGLRGTNDTIIEKDNGTAIFYREAVINILQDDYLENHINLGKFMATQDGKTIFIWIKDWYGSSYTFTGTRIR